MLHEKIIYAVNIIIQFFSAFIIGLFAHNKFFNLDLYIIFQNGEVDCWALDCPTLSCSNIIHEEGDCCPRCVDDDPCQATWHSTQPDERPSPMSMVCFFDGKRYNSGEGWIVDWDICSACTCQVCAQHFRKIKLQFF